MADWSITPQILFFALAGGILPTIIWLLFWLREDARHPEPRGLIITTFFAGAFSVVLVLPLEQTAAIYLKTTAGFTIILVWAFIEEIMKYFAAWITDFGSKEFDEPIDAMIYLITVALGFAATENTLFILKDVMEHGTRIALLTTSMRAIGATLLHVAASASLGGMLALAFYKKSKFVKFLYTVLGILTATLLHTAFNHFIMDKDGQNTLVVFGVLWLVIIGIILLFEKIKTLYKASIV